MATYRTNEAALAGQVSERRAENDVPGMIKAATELWLSPLEQTDAFDQCEEEAWRTIVNAGAVSQAVQAAVALVRERRRLRSRAFVHVVQNIRGMREAIVGSDAHLDQPLELSRADSALLLELAEIVFDEGWTTPAYLGSICVKMVEGRAKRDLWPFLQQRASRMKQETDWWLLYVVLLATTSMGAGVNMNEWLRGWDQRPNVPMWAAQLMLHYDREAVSLSELASLARQARETMPADGSAHALLCIDLEVALRRQEHDAFLALVEQHEAALVNRHDIERAMLEHPLIEYVNSFKLDHAVQAEDLEHEEPQIVPALGLIGMAAQIRGTRVNQGAVDLARTLAADDVYASRVFLLFRELLQLERGDRKRAVELCRELRSFKKPPGMSWVQQEWNRVLKTKTSLLTRLQLAVFG